MSNIANLVKLKSELSKRKAEAHLSSKTKSNNDDIYTFKKSSIKVNDFEKPAKKQKIDYSLNQNKNNNEYTKSFENMERKAKLYDQLVNQKIKPNNDDDYLIDFSKKPTLNSCYNNPKFNESYSNVNKYNDCQSNNISNETDDNYYTNVLNTEIREHGTGFYKFSSNITERNEQIKNLKQFQTDIEKEKLNLNKTNEIEKEKIELRLKKITQKYNVDLPVDDLLPKFQNATDSEENVVIDNKNNSIDDFLSEIRETSKPKSKREWDRGKKLIHLENDKKTSRDNNFAPPMFY